MTWSDKMNLKFFNIIISGLNEFHLRSEVDLSLNTRSKHQASFGMQAIILIGGNSVSARWRNDSSLLHVLKVTNQWFSPIILRKEKLRKHPMYLLGRSQHKLHSPRQVKTRNKTIEKPDIVNATSLRRVRLKVTTS